LGQGAVLSAHVEDLPNQTERDLSQRELRIACEMLAGELAGRLSPACRLIVRPPFVLGGDLPEADLDEHYRETIVPTLRALSVSYIDRQPTYPVVLLMFSGEAAYREHAQRLDGRPAVNYHGYYQREKHRALLNIATGSGTLAHELTHALAHSDFPDMPEWFDEGLASLHEESEFSTDGLHLVGLANWRLYYLIEALEHDRLQSLESFVRSGMVRGGNEAVGYAQARYLCLYLQHRGLLEPFYRKFRSTAETDPMGEAVLCRLLQVGRLGEADAEFRAWISSLARSAAESDATQSAD